MHTQQRNRFKALPIDCFPGCVAQITRGRNRNFYGKPLFSNDVFDYFHLGCTSLRGHARVPVFAAGAPTRVESDGKWPNPRNHFRVGSTIGSNHFGSETRFGTSVRLGSAAPFVKDSPSPPVFSRSTTAAAELLIAVTRTTESLDFRGLECCCDNAQEVTG
jgi:hypothetical protein